MVNPLADDAVGRTSEALTSHRLRGVCLFPAMHRVLAARPSRRRRGERRVAYRTAVFVHCGVLSVGARKKLGVPSRFEARLGQPLDVQALAVNWPRLPFIIPHFGAGFFREALMAADMSANIHLDTSSSNAWMKYIPA